MEERLQRAQAGKQEALERARLEREREALQACTFAPRLVTKPERLLQGEHTPLHRRLGEEARRRSTKLAQARLQAVSAKADVQETDGTQARAAQPVQRPAADCSWTLPCYAHDVPKRLLPCDLPAGPDGCGPDLPAAAEPPVLEASSTEGGAGLE